MKKLIGIVSLVCYLVSSLSLSIAVSYCNQKITGISLYHPHDVRCCCDDASENECCDDDVIKVDKTDDHYPFSTQLNLEPPIALISLFFPQYLWRDLNVHVVSDDDYRSHPPPILFAKLPLYIFISALKI
jgi:hypothetical protein